MLKVKNLMVNGKVVEAQDKVLADWNWITNLVLEKVIPLTKNKK